MSSKITFIGAGNMASSLIGGLIKDGWDPDTITASDPDANRREQLVANYPIHTSDDNQEAVSQADIVVLAVKPQIMGDVLTELAAAIQQNQPLVVSIAAGIQIQSIQKWLSYHGAIVRTMPNTPALVQSGATVLYANDQVSNEQRNLAESILRAVGLAVWVEREDYLDAVTALSGSGPAYFFLVIECLQDAAIKLGLPEKVARLLSIETAFGAAKMALEASESPQVLRERVTSPGGTTERALSVLEQGNIRELFLEALTQATERSKELAKQLGA